VANLIFSFGSVGGALSDNLFGVLLDDFVDSADFVYMKYIIITIAMTTTIHIPINMGDLVLNFLAGCILTG
jgi:hypothetical protein